MIVGIATIAYSYTGSILLPILPTSDFGGVTRRVSKSATLDGGASISNLGISIVDRTLKLKFQPTLSIYTFIKSLVYNNTYLVFSTGEGCFIGTVDSYTLVNGIATLSVLVTEKLSQ